MRLGDGSGTAGEDIPKAGTAEFWQWIETQKFVSEADALHAYYEAEAEHLKKDYITRLSTLTDKVTKIRHDLNKDRVRSIEIIGLFVAFITFATAETKIIVNDGAQSVAGYSLLLLGGLGFFVLLVHLVTRSMLIEDENNLINQWFIWIVVIILIILLFGIGLNLLAK